MVSYMKNLSSSFTNLPSASSWFEVYAAFSTFMMLLRTAINDLIPHKVRSFIASKLENFFSKYQANNQVSLKISRYWDESSGNRNELYYAAEEYLPSRITRTYRALKVGKLENHKSLVFAVDGSHEVVDEFEGTKFTWMLDDGSEKGSQDSLNQKKVAFILTFNEKYRKRALDSYLPHVLTTYEAMKAEQRIVNIYSWSDHYWNESELSHPATFDTLALTPELKQDIIDDLDRFLRRKELYKKVGKPWKRGYLLYGPPGTGKSSLIAAIANYLKFDVYDLELTSIYSNSDLMRAMRDTSNRSIVVIEDVDCNKEVHARSKPDSLSDSDSDSDSDNKSVKVKTRSFTLSGLLNYMDGLWSSGGEERIIILTTNHKERLDPALLRPGRMDKHINLSFLKAKAFPTLASNYLGIEGHHPLFEHIEGLLEKIQVTPAVVAEHLMTSEDPEVALEALVKFLEEKDMDNQVECQLNSAQLSSSIGD
ncbi:AAA-ATPase At2g18193-like [Gastrolobium bilobum]|uniref:AAA-ATPase At2g18193-like n=1 Tax=Gastrolobium bilobum TaxID=150636 RepID=UPI002AB09EED|nr:AAA-ATPase At2g18193-like [Gastrolobium bilobum]